MGKLFADYPGLVARAVSTPGREMIGTGLFAADYFSPGEVVLKLDWPGTSRVKIVAWEETDEKQHHRATAIAPRQYFCFNEDHPFWFLNHSCHPNLSYRNWGECEDGSVVTLAAWRPIGPAMS